MDVIETPTQIDRPASITFEGPQANFADDPDVMDYIQRNVVPLVTATRESRNALESEWLEIQKMSFLKHGESQKYKGMSQAYVPAYANNLDKRVSHISKGLFPTDDYLGASARSEEFRQFELEAKAWMQYQLGKKAKLRSRLKPWLRQLHDFGVTAGKVWYQTCPAKAKKGRRTKANPMESLMAVFDSQKDEYGKGIRFRTSSMFAWHMWPLTVNSVEEASIVFEDMQVSRQFCRAMLRSGEWKNEDYLAGGSGSTDTDAKRREQLSIITGLSQTAMDSIHGEIGEWVEITEVYVRMPVPASRLLEGESADDEVPVQLLLCNGMPIVARRNPFWFQGAPYIVKTLNERADSLYGIGMGRQALDLQGLTNDFVNQTNDNGIYGLNPIAKVNPNIVTRMGKIGPGSTWYMTDPNGLVFDRPPVEQLQYGQSLTSQIMGYMNDLLGTPPIMQGTGAKGAARTATGAQILQNNVKTDIQDVLESIEEESLEPLMDMAYCLGQQYEPQEQMIQTAGAPIKVTREMWEGEYGFTWNASSQNMNSQARSQTALQVHQALMQTLPLLMQQGKMYDPIPLMRRLYEDGLGFKDFEKVITQTPVMPGMMPGAPGQPGGVPPGDSNAGASAVEQNNLGGGEDTAAGEGEAFAEVRDGADAMAGMMGGQGGY